MCNGLAMHELNAAERLLVLSFRLWALPHAQPDRIHPDWRGGFRSSGLDEVACTLFDPLLATLFSASLRPIEVHRSMCVGVSRDEEEFLWCVGLHQSDRADEAAEILANWLPPAAARVATSLIRNLAESLRIAGLSLLTHQFEHMPSRQLPAGVGQGRHSIH